MRVCARSRFVVGPRDTLRTQGRAQAVRSRFVVAVFLVVAVPCCPALHSQVCHGWWEGGEEVGMHE